MPACRFCTRTLTNRNRSREHVIPKWVLDTFGILDQPVSPTHQSASGQVFSQRSQNFDSLRNGLVCRPCNNGWLSRLESTVQPTIHALLTGKVLPSRLTATERISLARWAAKIAWLLNDCSNYRKTVPPGVFHHLFLQPDTLPPRTLVALAVAGASNPIWWIQAPTWIASICDDFPVQNLEHLAKVSLKVGLRFGTINLVVASWPVDGWKFYVARGFHEVLWPTNNSVGTYAKGSPIVRGHDPILSAHALIKIRQPGSPELVP